MVVFLFIESKGLLLGKGGLISELREELDTDQAHFIF